MGGGFNVILVAFDTLRFDRVDQVHMPNVYSLLRDSMFFTRHYSEGIPTHPSFTTIFTGVSPLVHGVVCHDGSVQLSRDIPTIPRLLKNAGYLTIAADNLATHLYSGWFAWGFDYYLDIGGVATISMGVKVNGEVVNARVREALELVNRNRGKPFLLFIHYWDPHTPYIPPRGYAERFYGGDYTKGDLIDALNSTLWGRFMLKGGWMGNLVKSGVRDLDYVRALYDGEVAYVDERFGEVLRLIEDAGLLDNTAIIITSDHGEALGEHRVYFDHHGLYEWDVHTPLIIRLPDKLVSEIGGGRVRGVVYDALVQNTDIAPTILDITGVQRPSVMTGSSLLGIARGEWGGYDAVYSLENTRQTARMIRTREWKLIQWIRADTYGRGPGHIELYNMSKDPGESRNLANEEWDIAMRMLGTLEDRYRRLTGGSDPLIMQEISMPIGVR
jgi:arylsulfatase A-like enzyme